MVHKMIKGKGIFAEVLILAVLILLIGFILGFYVETLRTNAVINETRSFEIEALDLKLQDYYYQTMNNIACKEAIDQNLIFAENLYQKGLILEQYENANQISEDLTREKKRYVLLKTELWFNSILLKNKCGGEDQTFHTVVYFYSNDKNDLVKNGIQMVFSNILKQVKEKQQNKIILLPIAGDLDLNSVSLQENVYNITQLPTILIDEKIKITEVNSTSDIENYLN
jgi:hypothetical protein